jgi:hypothetical protein
MIGTRAFVAAGGALASGCGEVGSPGSGRGVSGSGACVDVSHVAALQKEDLQVVGTGFDAYERELIRIVATPGEPTYGFGQAPIEGGAFEILLPGVLGDYTELGVHVDTVRDDACNPGDEPLWQRVTGPLSALGPEIVRNDRGVAVWEVTPDRLRTFEPAGPCNINGNFDLTRPIRCSIEP